MSTANESIIRILVAVRSRELKTALFLVLTNEPLIKIVGTAVNTAELLTYTRALKPDVILLDWTLPGTPLLALSPRSHKLKQPSRYSS